MSGPGADRRRMVVPEIERENWRWYLFELFCARRRIENVIEADLRPLWRSAVSDDDLNRRVWRFSYFDNPRRLADYDPALLRYVEAVKSSVAETFRLLRDGRPSEWGFDHLHARVEAWAGGGLNDQGKPAGLLEPDPHEPPPPLQPGEKPSAGFSAVMAELQIVVNPAGARVQNIQPTDEPMEWVAAGDFMRFEEWDDLRRTAYAAGDRQIEWMKTIFDEWYPSKRNPTTRERLKRDAEELARHLADRKPAPPDGPERDRLRRFAAFVGVDFPDS